METIVGLPKDIIGKVVSALMQVPEEQSTDVTISATKKKRSLNANAYYWTLADQIARAMSTQGAVIRPEDIYRNHIHDVGAYMQICIQEKAVEDFCRTWQGLGKGNITENMGESAKQKGYYWIKAYRGSSTYSQEEMSRLIDLCVQDAKELGINTMTPEEQADLISLWEAH